MSESILFVLLCWFLLLSFQVTFWNTSSKTPLESPVFLYSSKEKSNTQSSFFQFPAPSIYRKPNKIKKAFFIFCPQVTFWNVTKIFEDKEQPHGKCFRVSCAACYLISLPFLLFSFSGDILEH
jgi:hypothetical protein